MSGIRRWLARLLVMAAATILALKAGDLALGWMNQTPQRHLLRLPARASVRHQSTEFDYRFTTNSLGLRGPERPLAKPAGTRRIAVIGDSFVAGYGVADDEVLTARLEKLLNENAAAPTEVINVGRTGSSTIREYDLYRLIARKFSPDVVVLAYFLGNDLREVVEEHDQEELRRWHPQGLARRVAYGLCPNMYLELALLKLSAEQRASLAAQSEDDILAIIRRQCAARGEDFPAAAAAFRRLPAEVREGLAQGKLRQQQILPACYDPGALKRALDPSDEYFERAWPRTERHLELLREAVVRDGGKFVVLIIPDGSMVDREAHEFAASIGYEVDPRWLTGSCRTREAVRAWCNAAGAGCIDLTEPLRESATPLYYPQDGHFNAAGHERAAEEMQKCLTVGETAAH
jgi:lysophospholipase L1-like esterase